MSGTQPAPAQPARSARRSAVGSRGCCTGHGARGDGSLVGGTRSGERRATAGVLRCVVVGLLLRAVEVADRYRWRWLLEDTEAAEPLADHRVRLDPESQEVQAFEDLPRYLRWRADPDRRAESEAQLLAQVGAWVGLRVLGEQVGALIATRAPATVRVRLPPEAEFLLSRPLELAHVDGVPLATRGDVSLVYEVEALQRGKLPVGERLRMLAMFTLPTESTALGLRRERYELARLVRPPHGSPGSGSRPGSPPVRGHEAPTGQGAGGRWWPGGAAHLRPRRRRWAAAGDSQRR
jgi:hypothetical protein